MEEEDLAKAGLIELTPDMLTEIRENLEARKVDEETRYPHLVEACEYETRLAITAWVFKHVCDHARGGGTFRYLIYERLGFGADAYVPLYHAGGMDISNSFELPSEARP